MIINQVAKKTQNKRHWSPNPGWWDVQTILKNDTRNFPGKAIVLLDNVDPTYTFDLAPANGTTVQAIATSDGAYYTASTTHTWDKTQDKILPEYDGDENPIGTRYVILYFDTEDVHYRTFDQFVFHTIYAVFGCNLTKGSTEAIANYTLFKYSVKLQTIDFLEGYNIKFGADCSNIFNQCTGLLRVPWLDLSSATNLSLFCRLCYTLYDVAEGMDTSNCTNFSNFLYLCYDLPYIPYFDTSNGANFSNFLRGTRAEHIPNFNTSKGTNFNGFLYNAHNLKEIPKSIDTSKGTDLSNFCYSASYIKEIPDNISTESALNLSNFCYQCMNLEKLPDNLDTSKCTNFTSFCSNCVTLKKFPAGMDVSKGTNFSNFGYDCYQCTSLPDVFDMSNATNVSTFARAIAYNMQRANIILPNLTISLISDNSNMANNSLSVESMQFIADHAPTVSGKTVTLGAKNIARAGGASGAIVQQLVSKGWTVN